MLASGADELVAVGDPDQSIYAFRGSDPAAIRRFGEVFAPATGAAGADRRARHVAAVGRGAARVHPAGRRPAARAPPRAPGAGAGARVGARPGRGARAAHAPARRPRTSRTGCAPRTCSTGCRGGRWRCWSGPPSGTCRRCAGRSPSPGCPPRWPATRCRWSPSRRCCRSCGCWTARCGGCGPTTARRPEPGPDPLDEEAALALLTSPLGGADALALRRLRQELRRLDLVAGGEGGSAGLLVGLLRDARAAADRAGPDTAAAPAPAAAAARRPGAAGGSAAVAAVDRMVRAAAGDTAGEPARRVGWLLATARATARAGGTAEDVLWAVWSGLRAGRGVAAGQPPRRPGRGHRRPRPGRGGRPLRPRPPGSSTGCRRPVRGSWSTTSGPGDPGRHAGAEGAGRRRGPAAHRARGQGPGVGGRRGGRRAGGQLAGPAPARHPARRRGPGRPGRRPGAGPAGPGRAAAGRGAPAVLRRRHPGPPAADRQRGGRRGAPAVPVPGRAGPAAARRRRGRSHRCRGRSACRRWSPSCARWSPTPSRSTCAAGPPPSSWPGSPPPACPAPTRTTGGGWPSCPTTGRWPAGRRAGPGVAVRAGPLRHAASCAGCWRRWAPAAPRWPRSRSATRCTRSPRWPPTRTWPPRTRSAPRLEAALDRLDLGGAWTTRRERARAREMLGTFLRWHRASRSRYVLVDVEVPFSVAGRRRRGAARPGRPGGAGRGRPAGGRRPQDRPEQGAGRATWPGTPSWGRTSWRWRRARSAPATEPGGAALVQVGLARGTG